MSRLFAATVACASVGFVVMLVFEGPLARSVGMAALLGFVLCGVALIASPDYLGRDEEP
ncbi:MAG: hypothetical protein M3350_10085 [Actinomycetota bacterium]|nr:hypothetical protein [Actinomycetota bacterium]MDQ3721110.1 hypothetical protein [Actinomycetota bacterium]